MVFQGLGGASGRNICILAYPRGGRECITLCLVFSDQTGPGGSVHEYACVSVCIHRSITHTHSQIHAFVIMMMIHVFHPLSSTLVIYS